MQEIEVWVTETGPVEATMSYGVEGDDSEFKLPSWASGACGRCHRRDDGHGRGTLRRADRRRGRRCHRRGDRRNGAFAGTTEASAKAATAKAGRADGHAACASATTTGASATPGSDDGAQPADNPPAARMRRSHRRSGSSLPSSRR